MTNWIKKYQVINIDDKHNYAYKFYNACMIVTMYVTNSALQRCMCGDRKRIGRIKCGIDPSILFKQDQPMLPKPG